MLDSVEEGGLVMLIIMFAWSYISIINEISVINLMKNFYTKVGLINRFKYRGPPIMVSSEAGGSHLNDFKPPT